MQSVNMALSWPEFGLIVLKPASVMFHGTLKRLERPCVMLNSTVEKRRRSCKETWHCRPRKTFQRSVKHHARGTLKRLERPCVMLNSTVEKRRRSCKETWPFKTF